MKQFLATFALFAIGLPALAAPPWVGYWAENASWCEKAGDLGENTPDQYTATEIFGLEWSCEITKATEIGVGQSWAVNTRCLDAGFAYEEVNIFMITHTDRLLILSQDGETTDLIRCPKKPE